MLHNIFCLGIYRYIPAETEDVHGKPSLRVFTYEKEGSAPIFWRYFFLKLGDRYLDVDYVFVQFYISEIVHDCKKECAVIGSRDTFI